MNLDIDTPRWALPLLDHKRYKGAKGGRSSGKSHFFGEALIEQHILNPNLKSVCIREIQKSIKFSVKTLLESKIKKLQVEHLFEISQTDIKRKGHDGIIIFQGLQDHTADSIKSLEGFKIAWVEEAQSLSKRSMELLLPTIRTDGSEIWFSWNPENENDPVDLLFQKLSEEDSVLVHSTYKDNPFCPEEVKKEAERQRKSNPETYGHIWLGEYLVISDAQIFKGKYVIQAFEPEEDWDGPYHGLDFGFSNDPTAATRTYIHNNKLYIRSEAGRAKLELNDTSQYLKRKIEGIDQYVIRADSARPESVSYLKNHGLPLIKSVEKWPGSVEDGIEFLKSFDQIVIHPDCKETAEEARMYRYKTDKKTGDILPIIVDENNHYFDSIRYGLQPLIRLSKKKPEARVVIL